MDWSKPISTRTRKCQALYFRELHKRIKLERSSSSGGGGGSGYGLFEPGSDSGGCVVGGLKQCSGGVEVGRKRESGCKGKGKIEAISDEDDDVVFVGSGEWYSSSKERSGGTVGVRDKDRGAEVKLNEADEDKQVVSESDEEEESVDDVDSDRMSDSDYEVTESSEEMEHDDESSEEMEHVSESDEEEEHVDDVDSDRMGDYDYEVTESSEEMEHNDGDDHDGCYFAAKAEEKIDFSNISQESGRWIYWNEDQEENGWIAYYTQVEYGSDLVEGDEESIHDIGVVKTVTADGHTQQNSALKTHIEVKYDTHNDWVGTSKYNSVQFNSRSKSRLNSKKTADGSLKRSYCIAVEEEDDDVVFMGSGGWRSSSKDVVLISEDEESEGKADEVRMGTEAKVEKDDDNDEKNEAGEDTLNEVVSESDEEEEHVDDVDSDSMNVSDYEVTESSEEMEHNDGDDHDGCYFAAKAEEKIDFSNISQESGRWIYWNEDQEENGWIAYYTQVEYGSDLVEGDEESIHDIGVVKRVTADGHTQQNSALKKHIEVKYDNPTETASSSKQQIMAHKDKTIEAYNNATSEIEQKMRDQYKNFLLEHEMMRAKLATKMKELIQKEKTLDRLKAHYESEKEKILREKEMNDRAALEQDQADENVLILAAEHKREMEAMHQKILELESKLDAKQALELEIKQLDGSQRVMGEDAKVTKKIEALEGELEEKNEELDNINELNQMLINKERSSNDELQKARQEFIRALQDRPSQSRSLIGVKRMGELDVRVFHAATKRKFSTEEEKEEKAAELCSFWEDKLKDPMWHPFKIITVHGKEMEVFNDEDELLKKVRDEMGEEAWEAVKTALEELNKYNPSGRYPIPELWHRTENRRASLEEGAAFILRQFRRLKRS